MRKDNGGRDGGYYDLMTKLKILVAQLHHLEAEINELGQPPIALHQQDKEKSHLSFKGANGRLWIEPSADGIDVSLGGASLTAEMSPVMTALCGRSCDGYKQRNARLGQLNQPFWRLSDFRQLREAILSYSRTRRHGGPSTT